MNEVFSYEKSILKQLIFLMKEIIHLKTQISLL